MIPKGRIVRQNWSQAKQCSDSEGKNSKSELEQSRAVDSKLKLRGGSEGKDIKSELDQSRGNMLP